MRLGDIFGLVTPIKICTDFGDTGPRLINRCPACEATYQAHEKALRDKEAQRARIAQRRANGFDNSWD